jgi:hypothetical protein
MAHRDVLEAGLARQRLDLGLRTPFTTFARRIAVVMREHDGQALDSGVAHAP